MMQCKYCSEHVDSKTHYCGSYYTDALTNEKYHLCIEENYTEICRYVKSEPHSRGCFLIRNKQSYLKTDCFFQLYQPTNRTCYIIYEPYSSITLDLNLRDIYSQYNCDKDLYNYLSLLLLFS